LDLLDDPITWAWWLAVAVITGLFVMLLVVISTGLWSAQLAYALAAVALFSLGAAATESTGRGLHDLFQALARVEFMQPWWLVLLALIPLIIWLSFRSLAGLGPVRRWL